jgi:hypothetical protein
MTGRVTCTGVGSLVGQPKQHITVAGQGSAPADEVGPAPLVQRIHQVAL